MAYLCIDRDKYRIIKISGMKTVMIHKIWLLVLILVLISCEKTEQDQKLSGGFLSFSADGQTILSTAINNNKQEIKFEVGSGVDVARLVPRFEVPEGFTVYLNGEKQIPGITAVDFSETVRYILEDRNGRKAEWSALAVPLSKRIVVDASHDGGVWWYPQYEATGFDTSKYHQGKAFADLLRQKGFKVDELGRDCKLKEEHFFGYYIVIRVNGFQTYTQDELDVYTKLVKRGMNMVFFTDHKKYDSRDELGDLLGLNFAGVATGTIVKFTPHTITQNLTSLNYIAGSALINSDQNPDIEILGWLGDNEYADLNFNGKKDEGEPLAPPVMGILNYPKSKVFFIGDVNGLQLMPQPFIDNLLKWLKE